MKSTYIKPAYSQILLDGGTNTTGCTFKVSNWGASSCGIPTEIGSMGGGRKIVATIFSGTPPCDKVEGVDVNCYYTHDGGTYTSGAVFGS